MKYRNLGNGLKTSALGIGCMPMIKGGNIVYGLDADPDEAAKTIDEAIDMGVTFFDTAEVYGPFSNEILVGEAIRGKRDKLVIATKFGFEIQGGKPVGANSNPAHIRKSIEGSLQRLGVDHIDLYYQHRVDPSTPIEDVVGTLADLIKEGKIGHIGLSEAGPETIKRAAATAPITALQSEYSIWERDIEQDILPLCKELGIGFVPYSPLGRGFLTGQVKSHDELDRDDWRLNDPRFSKENFANNMKIVDVITAIAAAHGASPAQISLAWLLAQGDNIVPIPGSKRRLTMRDSMGASDIILSQADLAAIDAAAPAGQTSGPRYGELGMSMVRL
ncbi:aldo/keto reductase [Sphingorhabdus lutea]|uniref:Aldo/keto reductase n=1 Tax=Sphingorhabdus lutea TaxID=1913578 RepID=A0A1L3JCT7_9SPHN|nr:aldo/keto reductase [Sphingorhabdus lutea]APG62946.1 aldo/keto reductase [Sphingorhabdus lutea]